MIHDLLSIDLRSEQDVVSTRQRAREIGALLGLKPHDQTAVATAVSEFARQAQRTAVAPAVKFLLRIDPQPALVVKISDEGLTQSGAREPAIALITARRLVDEYAIETVGAGTVVSISKHLPRRSTPLSADAVRSIAGQIADDTPRNAMAEVQQQNTELVLAFDELQKRQADVERLNAELAETNRGVLALYAELDEKAETLRRASELKSRFLSDMTHELRTPLNAMISLSQLLLDRVDGELSAEQERQVSLIRKSAASLNEMVSDLLDIARIEAGKEDVRTGTFDVGEMFSALRGMFRPLTPPRVKLRIDDVADELLTSDERKVTQILRNLLSNAIKFTESGEISLRMELGMEFGNSDTIRFIVADSGIGIAPTDLARIFEDFAQVDGLLQRSLRGTGLGLPLTRKLSKLLGGDVCVESELGRGSTFTVTLPRRLERQHLTAGEGSQVILMSKGDKRA